MKTKTGVCRPCCEVCTLNTDDFEDGTIDPILWPTIEGTPVETGGIVQIQSDDHEYLIQGLDVKPDDISVKASIKVRFTKDFDGAGDFYRQGHVFDVLWDWRGTNEFMSVRLVHNAIGEVFISIVNAIDESNIALFKIAPPEDRNNWFEISFCIFKEPCYGYGYGDYGYGYGEGGWCIWVNANGHEMTASIPEPENLITGFGAAINPTAGGENNLYEVDDWKLSKISPSCKCVKSLPCLFLFEDFSGEDTTDLSPLFVEEEGDWQRTSERLNPPTFGTLAYGGNTPSIRLEGVKNVIDFSLEGAAGTIWLKLGRSKIGSEEKFVAVKFTCTGETAATVQLFNESGDISGVETLPPLAFSWFGTYVLQLCIDKDSISGGIIFDQFSRRVISIPIDPPTGLGAAITVSSMGADAWIDNYEISRLLPNCPPCALESCTACFENRTPGSVEIRLMNLSGDYAKLNGLYVLPYVSCASPMGTTGTAGSGNPIEHCSAIGHISSPFSANYIPSCEYRQSEFVSPNDGPAANYRKSLQPPGFIFGGAGSTYVPPEQWEGFVCTYLEEPPPNVDNIEISVMLVAIRAAFISSDESHVVDGKQRRRVAVRLYFQSVVTRSSYSTGGTPNGFCTDEMTAVEYFLEVGDETTHPDGVYCLDYDNVHIPFKCWEGCTFETFGHFVNCPPIEDTAVGNCDGWESLASGVNVLLSSGL
jgi:hypothetical protein